MSKYTPRQLFGSIACIAIAALGAALVWRGMDWALHSKLFDSVGGAFVAAFGWNLLSIGLFMLVGTLRGKLLKWFCWGLVVGLLSLIPVFVLISRTVATISEAAGH